MKVVWIFIIIFNFILDILEWQNNYYLLGQTIVLNTSCPSISAYQKCQHTVIIYLNLDYIHAINNIPLMCRTRVVCGLFLAKNLLWLSCPNLTLAPWSGLAPAKSLLVVGSLWLFLWASGTLPIDVLTTSGPLEGLNTGIIPTGGMGKPGWQNY